MAVHIAGLQGLPALHQLLLWEEAALSLKFRSVPKRSNLHLSAQELLDECERFLSDFAHAARTIIGEHPAVDAEELVRPGGLAKLCALLPALADLFRLAVRPEYADARWHVPTPQSARFPSDARGLPPV